MKRAVLVLTNSRDGEHSDVVIAKLRARGERVVRFDSDRIASGESKITVSAGNGHFTACLRSPESTFDLSGVKSVWYRRPQWFNSPIADPVQRQYAEDELSSLLFGMWHALPENTFWMNHSSCLDKARRKVYQLKLAQEIGSSCGAANRNCMALSFQYQRRVGCTRSRSKTRKISTHGGEHVD